jgi:hypothetical protein
VNHKDVFKLSSHGARPLPLALPPPHPRQHGEGRGRRKCGEGRGGGEAPDWVERLHRAGTESTILSASQTNKFYIRLTEVILDKSEVSRLTLSVDRLT